MDKGVGWSNFELCAYVSNYGIYNFFWNKEWRIDCIKAIEY